MAAIVETTLGTIERSFESELNVFRGIPFAAAPVGDLRFRAPQPHPGWDGVRDATEFGPIAIQRTLEGMDFLFTGVPHPQSEDCLFLNVWTPAVDDATRPVMVWIPGGAFIVGSGSDPMYRGANLSARGDVVMVTINYRLGVFGFLNDPDLDEINLGIRDQIAALRWVRDNIDRFGGDPGNVTIFGESSGGHNMTTLLAAPAAVGLFKRTIVQSRDPHYPRHIETTRSVAQRVYSELGVVPRDLDAMRALPASVLLEAWCAYEYEFLAQFAGDLTGELMTCPIVDDQVMPEYPLEVVRSGRAAGVDVMIGVTDDEFKLFAVGMADEAIDVDEASVVARLDALHDDGRRVYDIYRAAREARGEPSDPQEILIAALADRATVVPAQRIADTHAVSAGRSYAYLFDWKSPLFDGTLGACHAIDIPFTFGTQARAAEFVGTGPEVDALAEAVMDAWIAVARSGDPSTESLPWERYDPVERTQMMLGPNRRVEQSWRAAERAVWDGVV